MYTKEDSNPDVLASEIETFTSKGFVYQSENEKLLEDMRRPDLEKLQLFTRMLRRNSMINKVVITYNDDK